MEMMTEMIFVGRGLTKRSLLTGLLVMALLSSYPSAAALDKETISRRDLVIDLGNGLTTDAQLTYPSVGEGPFPGVLLVHGSGNTDMDEYLPPEISGTEEGSRPFLQIAEYLSERGVAVLRYNKRGVGLKGTILDEGVVVNTIFKDLLQDAEKALEVLIQQPEVDADDVTIIGHSEGTWIAPRIAIEDTRVKKIVLMSAAAHNLYDILYFQIVERGIDQFQEIDTDDDGSLSIQEVYVLPSVMADQLIENSTGEWLWLPGIDPNGDGYVSIDEELLPRWEQTFEYLTTAEYPGSKWMQSHFALDSNLNLISEVPASVLILQGKEDAQTPVSEALLLEQRLTEVMHPDHTLITYPDLGHTFYPREGLLQWLGPIQDYVLSDLAAWLKDPERDLRTLHAQLQTAEEAIYDFQIQLDELSSELDRQAGFLESQVEEWRSEHSSLQSTLAELEGRYTELQSSLDSSRNMTFVALGVAIVAFLMAVVLVSRRLSS
jgi:pimeloyl-ACP methyl ester carboxylesterase